MNKKMIFRILGALSSGLIIAGVFVPFVNVSGYSTNLWNMYEKSIYLPIIIIVFGLIGVIFFALNKKTEFAYMSTGAILFFSIMNGIEAINNNTFDKLGIGFYFLVAGAVLTGIMAFILNLKSKNNDVVEANTNQVNQESLLSQVDDLYSQKPIEQPVNNIIEPILPNSNMGLFESQQVQQQPIVEPIQPVQQQPVVEPIQPVSPINDLATPIGQTSMSPIQPINQSNDYLKPIPDVLPQQPVVAPQGENPVLAQDIANEVVQELKEGPHIDYAANDIFSQKVNPVVQEFTNQASPAPTNQNVNTGATDIFGQPINK